MAVFWRPLWALLQLARTDLHSHTILIPLITGYLLRVERRRFSENLKTSWFPAISSLLAAAFLAWRCQPGAQALALGNHGSTALQILALVLAVIGCAFLCLGSSFVRSAAFPLGFLVFMAPMPAGVENTLETWLKFASADAAAWMFDLAGTPALREGVFFGLPGLTIEVAQECSGIRSSYVLFITSLLASYLFLRSPWSRCILVLAVIPLGVIRNGFRIFVLGELSVRYGPQMIHTWIHHRGGPVFFVISLLPFSLLLWVLWRIDRRRVSPKQTPL